MPLMTLCIAALVWMANIPEVCIMYTVVEGCILRVIPNLQHRSNKKFAKNQAKNKSVTNVIHFC